MDYKKTLNLPVTKFAMKANLANKEPGQMKEWEKTGCTANCGKLPRVALPLFFMMALPMPTVTSTSVMPLIRY